jgi:peptidyl-prolyl cis-trans isomerase C
LKRRVAKPGRAGRAVALLCGALLLAACGRDDARTAPTGAGDAVVAHVDGQAIWASDVQHEAVAQGVIGEGERLEPASELFKRMLDEVVDQKLLAAEAQRRHIDADPAVRRRLAAERERILGDALVQKLVDQAINDSSVRGLYEEQRKLARPAEEFHARQIVQASEKDADAVRKQLASGASFETLAGERSIDAATRFNGGDLDYFTADAMPEAYGAALKTAKAGDLVGPFKTDAGWVILKLEDRRAGQPMSLEAARPQIVRFLTYDQVRDLLQRLRGKARIETSPTQTPPANPPPKKKP